MRLRSPILVSALSWAAFPVYLAQGVYTRERAMRLAPPKGPLNGQVGRGAPDIRLLTLGDSSSAGVGVDRTSDALAVRLAHALHDRTDLAVEWEICGHNSAVASQIRDIALPNIARKPYTHIVLMIGTNDIKNWHSGQRWKHGFGGLLYAVRARFPSAKVYWHEAIDMRAVPAIPRPLADILNWRRYLLNRKGRQLCFERGAVPVPPLANVFPEGFCVDGFHAGVEGYRAWAEHMADHIIYDMQPGAGQQPATHHKVE